jgi:hypothetical protein
MSNIVIGPYTITPEQFKAVRESLSNAGVNLPEGDSGVVNQKGVRATYGFTNGTLLVIVTDWPALRGGFVESRLKEAIESAIAST